MLNIHILFDVLSQLAFLTLQFYEYFRSSQFIKIKILYNIVRGMFDHVLK